MVGESNQNVILIQIDASGFAEFEISEFEISRVDCTSTFVKLQIDWSQDQAPVTLTVLNLDSSSTQPVKLFF